MNQTLQQRIRRRRLELEASIDDMAGWSELPAERWQAIENGDSLSLAELGRVAMALAVDFGTLLRGEESSPRRSVARFRRAAASFLPGRRVTETRTLALAAELGRIGGGLYRLLGRTLPLAGIRQPEVVSDRDEEWKQGYRLGAAARRSLGIPAGPIMDLQSALEKLGIHIATLPFSEASIDAASLMEEDSMPIILLNQRSPRVESTLPRRSTMAHEVCHLLHDAGEHELETRLSGNEPCFDAVEQRARAFAPAFLAPRDEVNHWFRVGEGKRWQEPENKVLALAKRWGLSWGGAVWHAKNCGLIRPSTAERLRTGKGIDQDWQSSFEQQPDRSAKLSTSSFEISPLCRGRLTEIVLDAYDAAAISEGRAREILSWG